MTKQRSKRPDTRATDMTTAGTEPEISGRSDSHSADCLGFGNGRIPVQKILGDATVCFGSGNLVIRGPIGDYH